MVSVPPRAHDSRHYPTQPRPASKGRQWLYGAHERGGPQPVGQVWSKRPARTTGRVGGRRPAANRNGLFSTSDTYATIQPSPEIPKVRMPAVRLTSGLSLSHHPRLQPAEKANCKWEPETKEKRFDLHSPGGIRAEIKPSHLWSANFDHVFDDDQCLRFGNV